MPPPQNLRSLFVPGAPGPSGPRSGGQLNRVITAISTVISQELLLLKARWCPSDLGK